MKTTEVWRLVLAFLCCLIFATQAVADENAIPIAIGLGFDFETGNYGTDVTTDAYTASVYLSYSPTSRLSFELTIPYITQSNSTTIAAGGVRIPVAENSQGGGHGGGHGGGSGGGPGAAVATTSGMTTSNITESQSGLGDMTLNAGYVLFGEGVSAPRVRPVVYVKFPTADEDRFLGTGEMDLGIGVELSKWINRYYLYTSGFYNSQGANDSYRLKNFLSYELGGGYQFTDRFSSMLSFWGATPPSGFSPPLFESQFRVNYQLLQKTGISGYIRKGFTDGSSDFGAGLSANFFF